jgi:2,3-bisphosphoglycerate-dependent phosphoglycerate mutase
MQRWRSGGLAGGTLFLLRHGQSAANAEDSFSGWLDVPLSDRGRREAVRAGELIAAQGPLPDVVHTSVLSRAVDTAELALQAMGRPGVPVRRSWRLNERHYGALQGRLRAEIRAEFGDELFASWRRSYEDAPPPSTADPAADAAAELSRRHWADFPPGGPPRTESLADVLRRLLPYWQHIHGDLEAGRVVLVVAHSNSLRALCMHLDGLDADEVARLDVPTGVPLRYDLGRENRPLARGGEYLDPAAAAAGVTEVRAQGTRRSASPGEDG